MRGLILCLVVIVAVDAVRSLPPTKTKKGKRPARFNDNPDFGLPSGADYPDSRRVNARPPAARRPAPASARAVPPASAGRPAPAAPAAVRPAAAPAAGVRAAPPAGRPAPAGRRNDNTDRGLPSGRDVPDNRRRVAAAAPAAAPAAPRRAPTPVISGPPPPNRRPAVTRTRSGPPPASQRAPAPGRRRNDNPDFGLPSGRDYPDSGFFPFAAPAPAPVAPVVPVAPVAPAAPVFDCDYYCQFDSYKPVCSIYGNTYDNDCYRQCRNEPRECENGCPCNSGPAPSNGGGCDYCFAEGNSPVCVDNEEVVFNECFAKCDGKTITCDGPCPCT